MKIMNVSLTIDVANSKHVQALEALMHTLGGHEQAQVIPKQDAKVEAELPPPAAPVTAPEGKQEAREEATKPLDIAELRTATSLKVKDFRAEIQAKLAELGAANVSSLPKDSYDEYFNFVQAL